MKLFGKTFLDWFSSCPCYLRLIVKTVWKLELRCTFFFLLASLLVCFSGLMLALNCWSRREANNEHLFSVTMDLFWQSNLHMDKNGNKKGRQCTYCAQSCCCFHRKPEGCFIMWLHFLPLYLHPELYHSIKQTNSHRHIHEFHYEKNNFQYFGFAF